MKNNLYWKLVPTELGDCIVVATEKDVCFVGTPGRTLQEAVCWAKKHVAIDALVNEENEVLRAVAQQLQEYVQGARKEFDYHFELHGTNFQKSVWQALQDIPHGTTTTYGVIAKKIGNPKASRAVGMAIGANPLSILIPCHRVIGANNSLTGYRGGLEMKKKLLVLENNFL